MTRTAWILGVGLALSVVPALSPARANEAKLRKKLTKAAAARAQQWFAARDRRKLLKKGSPWAAERATLRAQAVVQTLPGFAAPSYREALRLDARGWIERLYAPRRATPHWDGEPLTVQRAQLLGVTVGREHVSVEAWVHYDGREQAPRGLRTVWIKQKGQLWLARRPGALQEEEHPETVDLGPAPGEPILETGISERVLSANAYAIRVEEEIAARREVAEAIPVLGGQALADFGVLEEVAYDAEGETPLAVVRSGFLRLSVRVGQDQAEALEALEPGEGVFFEGETGAPDVERPWKTERYELRGRAFGWKAIRVELTGSLRGL